MQAISLSRRLLIRPNSPRLFIDNCKKIIAQWVLLLSCTLPPAGISSSDPRFITAFQYIDSILCGIETNYLLRRLAYIQDLRLSEQLQAVIRAEREKGSLRKPGCRDVSVAMSIYESAKESGGDSSTLRIALRERRRTCRRWMLLAGPSPLFLLAYSNEAETVMYVFPIPLKYAILHSKATGHLVLIRRLWQIWRPRFASLPLQVWWTYVLA